MIDIHYHKNMALLKFKNKIKLVIDSLSLGVVTCLKKDSKSFTKQLVKKI